MRWRTVNNRARTADVRDHTLGTYVPSQPHASICTGMRYVASRTPQGKCTWYKGKRRKSSARFSPKDHNKFHRDHSH